VIQSAQRHTNGLLVMVVFKAPGFFPFHILCLSLWRNILCITTLHSFILSYNMLAEMIALKTIHIKGDRVETNWGEIEQPLTEIVTRRTQRDGNFSTLQS
jgi:hypothetical protein